ncbi:MAG: hypothetical protein KDC27_17425 [Acidobacteria bacterium]|nr:hypothetical protein [Acidobacteriota bacterium]
MKPDWDGLTMAHEGEPVAPVDPRSVAPYALWSASMMAHSAVDPYWQAKVRYETAETPAAAAAIENACLSCHAPMQQYEARATGGLRFDAMDAEGQQGVSCTVCHQIDPANLGTPASFTAGFKINDRDQIYGPHRDPFPMPMRMHTGRTPTYAPHMTESALCGTCHTVITPTLDAKGNKTGEFLEQATYLEWTASAYPKSGKTCQTCHMPQLEDAAGEPAKQYIAHTPHGGFFPPTKPREPFGQHSFGGANVQMLSILADLLPGKREILSQSAERARATLDDGLAMRVDAARDGATLEAKVRLVNSAGHKYPSGFPSRRLWLHVTARDAAGKIVFESGAWNPQTGEIRSLEVAKKAIEPHHARITDAAQTQIYELEMANPAGQHTISLMRAAKPLKDNRLLPLGFADLDDYSLAPIGVGDDRDFRAGTDTVVFAIPVEPGAGPWQVEAEALYQSVKPAHTAVFDAGRSKEEKAFLGAFKPDRRAPVVVETGKATVQ